MTLCVVFKDKRSEKIKCWTFSVSHFGDLTIIFDDGSERKIEKDQIDCFGGW